MARTNWPRVKPILLQVLGYTFLVLGVLGLFLPFLQGFLFLFVGLIILSRHAPWARRLLDNIRSRHPKLDQGIALAERKTHEWGERSMARLRLWRVQARLALRRWSRWLASLRPAKKGCQPEP
jgi:uncharacterized protein